MIKKVFVIASVFCLLFLWMSGQHAESSVGNATIKIRAGTNPISEFSKATVLDYNDGEVGISVKLPGYRQSYVLKGPGRGLWDWSASIDDSNTVTVISPDNLKYVYYENCNYILTEIKEFNDVNVVIFDYNSTTGLIDRQSDGYDPNLYIEYGYEGNLLTTLTACDENNCREYTITYDSDDRAIAFSGSCECCGGIGAFQYEYDDNNLLRKVKDANNPNVVIYEYQYDSNKRITDIYLGEANDDNHIRAFTYTDNGGGGYILDIDDYVDANNYRVTREHRNSAGFVTKRIRYELINEDPADPVGDSFIEHIVYYYDPNNNITKKVVIPPLGDSNEPDPNSISGIRKEYTYDPNTHRLLTEKWFNANDANFTVISYTYEHTPDGSNVRIKYSTDARGAQTEYFYDGNSVDPNLTAMPQVSSGISGTRQLKYEYEYDSRNRVSLERQLDVNDVVLVQTKYEYDNYGNLIERYDDYNTPNEEITEYIYNGFNEITKMKMPSGVVTGRRYNSSGKLESDFVLADGNDFTEPNDLVLKLLSQTKYYYDNNGRIEKIARAEDANDSGFDFNSPSSWVETEYEYDIRGNRTKVIEDVDGLALETTYEYNNQGQVTKVMLPNGKWTKTVRDGRGMVAYTEVGYGEGESETTVATTEFYYDANGNLERQKSPLSIWTEYEYDDFDRVIKVTKGI